MTNPSQALASLTATIETLRSERGCPWDRRQTPATLNQHIQSECSELLQAIDNNDHDNIMEELGDLLYLVLMVTRMYEEKGLFDLSMVLDAVNAKLIRRHPHVFAGQTYDNEAQLHAQWQAIKEQEKKKRVFDRLDPP